MSAKTQNQGTLTQCWGECETMQWPGKPAVSLKVKHTPAHDPDIPILGIYPKSGSAQAAITSATNWGAYTTDICFLTVLEAGRLRSRCQQGCFLVRPLSWLNDGTFLLCSHVTFSLSAGDPSSSYQPYWIWASLFRPHLTLIISLKAPCPNTVTSGLRASTYEFCGGNKFSPKHLKKRKHVYAKACTWTFTWFIITKN